jgi:hypothetical protein
MNKSAILFVNFWWSQLTSTSYSCELFVNMKNLNQEIVDFWSQTFDRDHFLTLNTASGHLLVSGHWPDPLRNPFFGHHSMKTTGRFSYKEYFHILYVKHTKGRVKPVDGIVPGLVGRVGPAWDVRLLPSSSVGPAAGNTYSVFLFLKGQSHETNPTKLWV